MEAAVEVEPGPVEPQTSNVVQLAEYRGSKSAAPTALPVKQRRNGRGPIAVGGANYVAQPGTAEQVNALFAYIASMLPQSERLREAA